MDRRTYASTLVAATAGLAGCATLETESRSSTVADDDRVTLRAVRVQNDSDREAEVDITVVRNGANQFRSELDVPVDGQRAPATNWPTSGESFVVVARCPTYTSAEVGSLEHENNDRGIPYEMQFVIEETGGIRPNLVGVERP